VIDPRDLAWRPGTTPYKVTALWRSWVLVRPSFIKVSTYMIFKLLPPDGAVLKVLENLIVFVEEVK
jgi:hypothetical protein